MSIIVFLIILALLGFAYYYAHLKLPGSPIKMIILIAIFVIAIWLCLDVFGILDQVKGAKVPSL